MAAEANNIMICDGHFELGASNESRSCINVVSASLLDLNTKELRLSKGIKLLPGETFHYTKPESGHSIYIFEAGLDPLHAETFSGNIHIYVLWQQKKILVGTLSSAHSNLKLDLMMSGEFQLSHSGLRKSVYFNAYEFKPMALDKTLSIDTNKELWVTTVKPHGVATFDPINFERKYHLLKVFGSPNGEEMIDLHFQCDAKSEKIGSLSFEDASVSCNIEFDNEFSLSHTSEATDVVFYGYTVPYKHTLFELKELPRDDTGTFIIKPPKKSEDPEYIILKEVTALREAKRAKEEAKRARVQATREKDEAKRAGKEVQRETGIEPEIDDTGYQAHKPRTVLLVQTLVPAPQISCGSLEFIS